MFSFIPIVVRISKEHNVCVEDNFIDEKKSGPRMFCKNHFSLACCFFECAFVCFVG